MTLQEAIQKTYLETDGKVAVLAEGTAKYEVYKALLNTAKDAWYNEPDTYWNSTREYASIGTVTASDTFPLTGVGRISKREGDFILIIRTDGSKSRYNLVLPAKLYDETNDNVCAVQAGNLVFPKAFTNTDAEFGGTIDVPQYTQPADMDLSTDIVPVDNPYYAIYRAAAAKVANDVTKSYRTQDFISQATESMNTMKADNEAQLDEVDSYSLGVATGQSWD